MKARTTGVPLRTAVICGVAFVCGSGAGAVVAHIATAAGHSHPSLGPATAVLVALWALDKLDRLIADTDDRARGAKR